MVAKKAVKTAAHSVANLVFPKADYSAVSLVAKLVRQTVVHLAAPKDAKMVAKLAAL